MSNGITWLHLSDLHCGSEAFKDKGDTVLAAVRRDLDKQLYRLSAPLDLVLFTGDLTQSGKPDQFDTLNKFLEDLWKLFDKRKCNPKLFAVPGNHDLIRPSSEERKQNAIHYNALVKHWRDDGTQDEFWSGKSKSVARKIISKAFENYQNWWDSVPADRRLDCSRGILSGDCAATFSKDNIKLGLLGLNSAYLQLSDHISEDDGALDVRLAQAHAACGSEGLSAWVDSHDVCFLLTHHPATWLFEGGKEFVQEVCDGPANFALHLFGHMHEQRVAEISVQGGRPRTTVQGLSLLSAEPWHDGKRERKRLAAGYSLGHLIKRGTVFSYALTPRMLGYVGGRNQMVPDVSFEYESPTLEQTRWKPLPTRELDAQTGAARIPAAFVDNFRGIGGLKGPRRYSDLHDFLKNWLSINNRDLDHVTVKNIAFDLQHTYICLEALMDLPWPKGLTWRTVFIDHQVPELRSRIAEDPDSKIKAAEVNEGRLKSLIADTLPSLKKDISVEARAYNELPTMHGFLIDDSVLVVGVCDTFDGIIKTTPYMVFVGDQEEQNLDPDIARNMIEIFSSWFDAHWSTGRRINPGTPGVGDAKAVSP